jgi:hypothetical protein
MRTQRNQSVVSVASVVSGIGFAALFVTALGVGACVGRQHPLTQSERGESAESTPMTGEPRAGALQFDNQAMVYVDVYLALPGGALQWRLGRVAAGVRAELRIPQSAIDRTSGFVQLAVIPGSQLSADAWRDPRAVIAIPQPMSELLSQRWTFRQPAGTALQLQSTRLRERW